MGNMVTNVCAKSNYDRLRIDKVLRFRKFHSNNNKNKNRKPKTYLAIWEKHDSILDDKLKKNCPIAIMIGMLVTQTDCYIHLNQRSRLAIY